MLLCLITCLKMSIIYDVILLQVTFDVVQK